MPLNASIPLSAVGPQRPLDIVTPVVQGLQIRSLLQRQRAGEFELEEATRERTEQGQLRDIFARHSDAGTLETPAYLRDIGQISPQAYQAERNAQATRTEAQAAYQKSQVDLQKAEFTLQSARLDQAQEINEMGGQLLGVCLEKAGTEEGQACYERSKATYRQRLAQAGADPSQVDALPELLEHAVPALNEMRLQNLTTKDQLAEMRKGFDFQQQEAAALLPGKVAEAQAVAAAREPSQIRIAQQRGVVAAEKQKEGLIRAAEIEKSAKPLTGAQAKEVADLDATLELVGDVETLFKSGYVGQVSGRAGSVREFTGQIGDEEIEFRQVVQDIKDTLLRARSGAAINESEYRRLSRIVPNLTDQPNVFKAKLRRFERNLRIIRKSKLKIATTGRGELQEQGETGQSVPPVSKIATESDIEATMRSSGRSRVDVMNALLAKGYQFEGQ